MLTQDQEDYLLYLDEQGTVAWDSELHCEEPLPSFLLLPLEPHLDDISPAGKMLAEYIRENRKLKNER